MYGFVNISSRLFGLLLILYGVVGFLELDFSGSSNLENHVVPALLVFVGGVYLVPNKYLSKWCCCTIYYLFFFFVSCCFFIGFSVLYYRYPSGIEGVVFYFLFWLASLMPAISLYMYARKMED